MTSWCGGCRTEASPGAIMPVASTATGWARCRSGGYRVIGPLPPSQFAWLSSTTLVMADDQFLSVLTIDGERLSVRAGAAEPAGIMGLTVSPDGREIAV